jgi:primosomal protein N' (replication factor Y) (superfamily II helicase)
LYLLPEIALTAQIVGRLQKHFGDKILVYHSKFSVFERVEIWHKAMQGTPILLGARSSMFLPFKNLGLIIVDEEHDPSYKQTDPAPRYNARDTAVFLAHLYGCRTLLGTATPSIETYYNVQQKKYGLVEMKNRFGGLMLPEMFLVDLTEETKQKRMKSHFSEQLLTALRECFDRGEQAILFQNRRGYAPMYKCNTCGWNSECSRCDVAMTYHKHSNDLHCHYCGQEQRLPKACPACRSVNLGIQGFGTEKIEDELSIYLPEAQVLRMDLDTVKGKNGADKIIQQFEQNEVNVLVGTQMVTKGLDFDNVGLVGVLSADQMLKFPDFRASERAYQLLTQVAGRAGRKRKRGRVLVQAFQVGHPVLNEIRTDDFDAFLARELQERHEFGYPPFVRLIKIQLRHKIDKNVVDAAKYLAERLIALLGKQHVLGPAVPGISKIREYYILEIMLKLGRNTELINRTKTVLLEIQDELKQIKDYAAVRIGIDVDPY